MSADQTDDNALGGPVEITVQAITLDDLGVLLPRELLQQLSGLLEDIVPTFHFAPRGSRKYRDMLHDGTRITDVRTLVDGIAIIWKGYGWKGILDFQEILILQIARLTCAPIQDSYGRTRLDMLIRADPDEEALLETAVMVANDPQAQREGLDFASAYAYGQEMAHKLRPWVDVYQHALDACTAGREREVWPILMRMPGLRGPDQDRERVVQGTLMLALAVMSLHSPAAVAGNQVDAGVPESEFSPELARASRKYRRK